MRLRLLATIAALLASTLAAKADTFQSFNLNAKLYNGVATGTVTFNQTTGLFSGGDIQASYGNKTFNFNVFDDSNVFDTVTFSQQDTASNSLTFQLAIPGVSNQNYMGGYICSDAHYAGCQVTGGPAGDYYYTGFVYQGNNNFASSGTLTAATPEPSSLALLGTGIIGLIGAAHRRFVV